MKKAPENRGLGVISIIALKGAPTLLLLFCGGLLLRGGFLGCTLHRLILPNIKFCDQKNRNVIHI
jgi:hypothetical protein